MNSATPSRAQILSHHAWIEAEHISFTPRPQAADASGRGAATGTLAETLQQVEREMIERALRESGDNRSEAARKLGLSRQQLYRKLEEHGLT